MRNIRTSQAIGSQFLARSKKSIMTMTAAVACAFALTACGGGSNNDSNLSRADEGIWSDHNGMQAVILDDGSYWGVYGTVADDGTYDTVLNVMHGTASVSGGSVSGAYTDFPPLPGSPGSSVSANDVNLPSGNWTYSGTVSAQKDLNVTFNGLSSETANSSFNMSYDSIYTQPASLAAIAGNYLAAGDSISHGFCYFDCSTFKPSLTISGSNLTFKNENGGVIMTGTLTPHGTTANVFDVFLTGVPPDTTGLSGGSEPVIVNGPMIPAYMGILFQTSSGSLKNYIEIVATSGSSNYFYMGSKQD